MARNAFTMKLKPGCAAEYKKRHDAIWPELADLLSASGITEYSIYLEEETHTLFAFQKLANDFDPLALPNHPIVKTWWTYMADIMEVNVDNSPKVVTLNAMFYLE